MTTIFGPIIDGGAVEQAVLDTLKAWLHPTYVVELERRTGRTPGDLPAPRDWRIVNQLEAPLGPRQLPAVWLVSAGLDGEPERTETGYQAAWLVAVAVIVSAKDHEHTLQLARLYAAAIRATLIQKPGLGGLALGTEWVDEAYDRGPVVLEEQTAYGTLTFRVHVADVTDPILGPEEPLPDPDPESPEAPVVETVEIEFTPTEDP